MIIISDRDPWYQPDKSHEDDIERRKQMRKSPDWKAKGEYHQQKQEYQQRRQTRREQVEDLADKIDDQAKRVSDSELAKHVDIINQMVEDTMGDFPDVDPGEHEWNAVNSHMLDIPDNKPGLKHRINQYYKGYSPRETAQDILGYDWEPPPRKPQPSGWNDFWNEGSVHTAIPGEIKRGPGYHHYNDTLQQHIKKHHQGIIPTEHADEDVPGDEPLPKVGYSPTDPGMYTRQEKNLYDHLNSMHQMKIRPNDDIWQAHKDEHQQGPQSDSLDVRDHILMYPSEDEAKAHIQTFQPPQEALQRASSKTAAPTWELECDKCGESVDPYDDGDGEPLAVPGDKCLYCMKGHLSSKTANTITTADGERVGEGDLVFNYYDGKWGRINNIDSRDGWFDHVDSDGGRTMLNGERVCKHIPPGNPYHDQSGWDHFEKEGTAEEYKARQAQIPFEGAPLKRDCDYFATFHNPFNSREPDTHHVHVNEVNDEPGDRRVKFKVNSGDYKGQDWEAYEFDNRNPEETGWDEDYNEDLEGPSEWHQTHVAPLGLETPHRNEWAYGSSAEPVEFEHDPNCHSCKGWESFQGARKPYSLDQHETLLRQHLEESHPKVMDDWGFRQIGRGKNVIPGNYGVGKLTELHLKDHMRQVEEGNPTHSFQGGRDLLGWDEFDREAASGEAPPPPLHTPNIPRVPKVPGVTPQQKAPTSDTGLLEQEENAMGTGTEKGTTQNVTNMVQTQVKGLDNNGTGIYPRSKTAADDLNDFGGDSWMIRHLQDDHGMPREEIRQHVKSRWGGDVFNPDADKDPEEDMYEELYKLHHGEHFYQPRYGDPEYYVQGERWRRPHHHIDPDPGQYIKEK